MESPVEIDPSEQGAVGGREERQPFKICQIHGAHGTSKWKCSMTVSLL